MADIPLFARIPRTVDEALGHASDNDFAIAMSNLVFAREAAVGYDSLTSAERVIFLLDGLEREVNNGGFEQFFVNSAGDYSLDTPVALRSLGANRVAAIVERALVIFPGGQPARDRNVRQDQVQSLSPKQRGELEGLDAEFLAYPEPLAALERKYVQAHRTEFLAPPNAGGAVVPSN